MSEHPRPGRLAWATPANLDSLPAPEDACRRCGTARLQPARVESAAWRDGRLVIVRSVPALVCPSCGEEQIAAATTRALDRLWARREEAEVIDQMIVPVLAWDAELGRAPEEATDTTPARRPGTRRS